MMRFPLCNLLLSVSGLFSWSVVVSSISEIIITQPPNVTVLEGETVGIICCWDKSITKGRVNWLKNQTKIKNENTSVMSTSIENSRCEGSLKKEACKCSTLTLSNVSRNDSDTYFCMVSVEIPSYVSFQGDGTVVNVVTRLITPNGTHAADSSTSPLLSVMVPLTVVVPIFLLALVCFWNLRRRQGSEKAAKVIYEVPHHDSEQLEVDGHSTSSSRGSSQWCQVPVYESFDYFERTNNKESD